MYSGLGGKRVWVYGAWGPTSIPPPSPGGDACYHAHTSYGVWGWSEITFAFLPNTVLWTGWSFLGGGGMSGNRNANNQCVLVTNSPTASLDLRFGWGQMFLTFDFREPQNLGWLFIRRYTNLVVGALSNTHGWGSCKVSPNTFQACFEPSYIWIYTSIMIRGLIVRTRLLPSAGRIYSD
jgi:hypothetical protein